MNWISNVVPPKIRSFLRRDTPENLWVKCPESGQLVFHKDLEANLFVVPGSGYHMAIGAKARLASLFDEGRYDELPTPEVPSDPLKFRDIKRYSDRLKEYRLKTGASDAVTLAFGKLEGLAVTAAVQVDDHRPALPLGSLVGNPQDVVQARPLAVHDPLALQLDLVTRDAGAAGQVIVVNRRLISGQFPAAFPPSPALRATPVRAGAAVAPRHRTRV